jgi:outer membrane biosynthesis protein TonB
MANIKYEVTRWDVSCCHHTHPTQSGHAESVILGITATDSESGKSAYKDERISVNPCVELGQFEANAEQWIENQIGSGGWYLELQTRIAAQLVAPEPAPQGRTKPDFSKMVIGDGYQDFPEEEKDEEKPAEDAKEEEAPKEEAKPAAKKKAAKKKAAPKEEAKEEAPVETPVEPAAEEVVKEG